MVASAVPTVSIHELQERFTAQVRRIQTHARVCSGHITCEHQRAEFISEVVGLCWQWWLRLVKRGKDPSAFVSILATFAVRHVKAGRRLCGQFKAKDVLSERAQQRHGFRVQSLPHSTCRAFSDVYLAPGGQRSMDAYEEDLRDNTRTPPPEQANFRLAFPQLLASLTRRDRKIAEFLALGNSGKQASRKFKISCGRITGLRQAWCRAWYAMNGETAPFEARRARPPQAG